MGKDPIIISATIKPSTLRKIKDSDAFTALITPNFVEEPARFEECKAAKDLDKLMYAIVLKGTNWDKFKVFPWRGIYHSTGNDIDKISKKIGEDIRLVRSINRM